MRLDITPTALDAGIAAGDAGPGRHDRDLRAWPVARRRQITWPAQGGSSARLVLDPVAGGPPVVFEASGPWALFRLIGQGSLQQDGSPDRYHAGIPAGRAPGGLRAARQFGGQPAGGTGAAGLPVPGAVTVAGFFGKLPARGDFVRAGLPRSFTDPWDAWLRQVLPASRRILGEAWEPAWLEAPVWRFALPPGVCGPEPVTGLWLPSVDRVGRYFPLTLACVGVDGSVDTAFLTAAEAAGRAAIAEDWPPEGLSSCSSSTNHIGPGPEGKTMLPPTAFVVDRWQSSPFGRHAVAVRPARRPDLCPDVAGRRRSHDPLPQQCGDRPGRPRP